MSVSVTRGVRIEVHSEYMEARSNPGARVYFFIYHVQIENLGSEPVTLEARHWIITNGFGDARDVQGPGVVGETPRLEPGDSFAYTSACPINTAVGSMCGSYRMRGDSGVVFDAEIGTFTLSVPYAIN